MSHHRIMAIAGMVAFFLSLGVIAWEVVLLRKHQIDPDFAWALAKFMSVCALSGIVVALLEWRAADRHEARWEKLRRE
ncbi:hypothetical protein HYW17_01955 [Candidatus Uhrbacteria bacterium]|nr:hypothetical protein [Candidatus Uhrbacteria bacterium]